MEIYKIYRDCSDGYESYQEYGFYFNKEKAINDLEKIIRNENTEIDENEILKLRIEDIYEIYYVGHYGIEKIKVID